MSARRADLRQYASWCHRHHLRLFQPPPPPVEPRYAAVPPLCRVELDREAGLDRAAGSELR